MRLPWIILAVLLIYACRDSKKPAQNDEDKKVYLPVADYIKSQVKIVDSLPGGILKRVKKGDHSDSAFISAQEFDQLAAAFLSPELEKASFERNFTETSFYDQTTESLSFTYKPRDEGSIVKRVDVLASPSLHFDQIKSIYIEKIYASKDTTIYQKLYWKPNQSFQVITTKNLQQQPVYTEQVKVIWDPFSY